MHNRKLLNIFTNRDLETLTREKRNTLQKEALNLVFEAIKETDDVFRLLDLMHDIFWYNNHYNDLKLERNIVCLWTYQSDTSALRKVINAVKAKILNLLTNKDHDFLNTKTHDQAFALNELLLRKSSSHTLFGLKSQVDISFQHVIEGKFKIKHYKTTTLK